MASRSKAAPKRIEERKEGRKEEGRSSGDPVLVPPQPTPRRRARARQAIWYSTRKDETTEEISSSLLLP